MDYKEIARASETTLSTGIHTRINDDYRISSVYRRFANAYFESWGWETFLWNGISIEKEYDVLENADQVVNLHTRIFKELSI